MSGASQGRTAALAHALLRPVQDGPHETPEWVEDGVPFLSVDGIVDNRLKFTGCRYISRDADIEYSRKSKPQRGDVLLTKAASIGKVALVDTDADFNVWSPLAILRPDPALLDSRFLYFALQATGVQDQLQTSSTSNTQQNVAMSDISALKIFLPSIGRQRAVGEYLDRETGRIDALITAKRRMVELWDERKRIWLAEHYDSFAADFGLAKMKRMVRGLRQGWSPQCEDRRPETGEWSVLKAGAVNGGTFRSTERKVLPSTETVRHEYLVRAGDLLINRANGSLENLGSAATAPDEVPEHTLFCDKIFRVQLDEANVDARWLAAMLAAYQVRDALMLGVSGAEGMANSLPSSVILDVRVPKADVEHQRKFVVDWLRFEDDTRRLIGTVESSVALLGERRQELITAAVTGQIDIPEAA
jgi:type I restriction enzyme, S subunit